MYMNITKICIYATIWHLAIKMGQQSFYWNHKVIRGTTLTLSLRSDLPQQECAMCVLLTAYWNFSLYSRSLAFTIRSTSSDFFLLQNIIAPGYFSPGLHSWPLPEAARWQIRISISSEKRKALQASSFTTSEELGGENGPRKNTKSPEESLLP